MPIADSLTLTQKQEISCAEIKERRAQPQPTTRRRRHQQKEVRHCTVYAFYEQRITRNLVFISFQRILGSPPCCEEIYVQWSNGRNGVLLTRHENIAAAPSLSLSRVLRLLARKSGKASRIPLVKRGLTGQMRTFPVQVYKESLKSRQKVW